MDDIVITVRTQENYEYLYTIDEYIEIKRNDVYFGHSTLEITLPINDVTLQLLSLTSPTLRAAMKLITVSDEPTKMYYTEVPQLIVGKESYIYIMCYSVSRLLSHRVNYYQYKFTAIDRALAARRIIHANMVSSSISKRNLPGFRASDIPMGSIYGGSISKGKKLDVVMDNILRPVGASWEVTFTGTELVFIPYKGANRTSTNTSVPPVVLTEESEAFITGEYTDDKSGFYNCFVTKGVGDENKEFFELDNFTLSGWNRREAFIENRDLKQTFKDDEGNDVHYTDELFEFALIEEAQEDLEDFNRVANLSVEAASIAHFKYGYDYFLGDLLTVNIERFGLSFDLRLSKVITTYNARGKSVSLELGEAKLNYIRSVGKGLKDGTKK